MVNMKPKLLKRCGIQQTTDQNSGGAVDPEELAESLRRVNTDNGLKASEPLYGSMSSFYTSHHREGEANESRHTSVAAVASTPSISKDSKVNANNAVAVLSAPGASANTTQNPPGAAAGGRGKSKEEMRKLFIDRAKKIDTVSRAGFPLAFLFFNIFYWVLYKILRHEDVLKQ